MEDSRGVVAREGEVFFGRVSFIVFEVGAGMCNDYWLTTLS